MTKYALNNKGVIIFFFSLIILLGLQAVDKVPKEEFPEFPKWNGVIVTRMEGASPLKMEELITEKIEEKLMEVGDLSKITSISQTGVSYVFPEIGEHIEDTKIIWDNVRDKLSDLKGVLPQNATPPWLDSDLTCVKSFVIAICGDGFSNKEMVDIAKDLKKDISQVEYVKRVDIIGKQEERIIIESSNAIFGEMGISPELIAQMIIQQNVLAPGGDIKIGPQNIRLEPTGEYQSIEDIEKTVITIPGHTNVMFLKDICTVKRTYIDPPNMEMRYMGQDAVGIVVEMEAGGQILKLGENISALLKEKQNEMFIGIDLNMVNFQPKWVEAKIFEFTNNLWQAIFIVLLIMIVLLGWREGLIISALIPFSFLITITVMERLSIPINQISLVSLIIALGMLVDNGIVMTESISAYIKNGTGKIEAAIISAKELTVPLLTATGTTVAAFLPIALAESAVGIFCRTITYGVGIVLLSSFFVSMTLIPILCVKVLKPKISKVKKESWFNKIYYTFMKLCLKYKYTTLLIGIVLFVIVMTFVEPLVKKVFFPPSDRSQFLIDFYMPEGTDYRETKKQCLIAEEYILETYKDKIKNFAIYVGEQGPRFAGGVTGEQRTSNYAQFVINNYNYEDTKKMANELKYYFIENFENALGIVKFLETGPPIGAPIQVRVFGKKLDKLYSYTEKINKIMEETKGIRDIRDDWGCTIPKLSILINQDQARRVGVSSSSIAKSLQQSISGLIITAFREGDNSIPIIGRIIEEDRNTIRKIQDINIPTMTGTNVPLLQVANLQLDWEAGKIRHLDRRRTITILAYNATNYNSKEIIERIKKNLADIEFEPGYGVIFGGEEEGSQKAQKSINDQIPISMAILVMILVAQFANVRKMVIILMTIPLAFIGVFTGLLITNMSFGFMAFLGIISLAGIVVNNAILLIEQIDLNISDGIPPVESIINAGQRRAFPIILTTLTTLSGLLPLAISGEFWGPMAVTIMSGLLASTFLTLAIIPTLYAIFFRVK